MSGAVINIVGGVLYTAFAFGILYLLERFKAGTVLIWYVSALIHAVGIAVALLIILDRR
jgi:hypothetical protein